MSAVKYYSEFANHPDGNAGFLEPHEARVLRLAEAFQAKQTKVSPPPAPQIPDYAKGRKGQRMEPRVILARYHEQRAQRAGQQIDGNGDGAPQVQM